MALFLHGTNLKNKAVLSKWDALDSAKHSEAFMDVISAYFFTSYLHKRAQKMKVLLLFISIKKLMTPVQNV